MKPLATSPRSGFETSISVPEAATFTVQALDERGRVLGTSAPFATSA
jgi:hypothetical protein